MNTTTINGINDANSTSNKTLGEKTKQGWNTFKQDLNQGMKDPNSFSKTVTFKILCIIIGLVLGGLGCYGLYKFIMSDEKEGEQKAEGMLN